MINRKDNTFDSSNERNQPNFSQHPEKHGDKDHDHLQSVPHIGMEEEKVPSLPKNEEIKLIEVNIPSREHSFTKEYIMPGEDNLQKVPSSQEIFNNTVNLSSHQRLCEIEEKRK